MGELDELKELVKTGSVQFVSEFGDSAIGRPKPYAVIKPSKLADGKRSYRITAHFAIGENKKIEEYVNCELPELIFASRNIIGQSKYKIIPNFEGVIVDPGDNTLSMSREFFIPAQ